MALTVKTGPTSEGLRILLHGQEGVGKTTWAAGCPRTVFLTAEDGGGDLDYARAVLPTWTDLRAAVKDLAKDPQGFRTVCIDTIDSYERILWDLLAKRANVNSIEDVGGGYGKGYTAAAEEMAALSRDLDTLRAKHRMHVIILAHSHVRPFNDPLGNPFDRYELRMHKGTSALWLGWADAALFACFDVTVKTARRNAAIDVKGKAVEARRVLYTSKDAAYDAKNRYNLPEELPLSWPAFAQAIGWNRREAALLGTPTPTAQEPDKASAPEPERQAPKANGQAAADPKVAKAGESTLATLIDTFHARVLTWPGYEGAEPSHIRAALEKVLKSPLAELTEARAQELAKTFGARTDVQLQEKFSAPLAEAGVVPF